MLSDSLSAVTAHQDDRDLHPHTVWSLRNGRPCCAKALTTSCECLQSFVCERHGRHCFGPHEWESRFRSVDEESNHVAAR